MKLFVIGIGRSGTSLLQSMLAAHGDIAFLPETAFVRRYVQAGRVAALPQPPDRQRVEAMLRDDRYFSRTGLNAGDVVEQAASVERITDAGLYRAMVSRFAMREVRDHTGDKDPRSIESLELIDRIQPDTDFVHVVRDPRDCLLSRTRAAWSRDRSLWREVFAIRVQLRMITDSEARGDLSGRIHTVRYEQLLGAPRTTLETLCRSVGLPFDDRMLDFADSARALVSEEEMSWKKETLGPLLEQNANKWPGQLTDWQVAMIEHCCALSFERFDYSRSDARFRLTARQRVSLAMAGLSMAVLDPVYRSYRRWANRRAANRS